MPKYTRAEFLGRSATLAAALGVGCVPAAAVEGGGANVAPSAGRGTTAPDLVLINGRIYTVDDAQPRAEAFAVKNGRFVAVGSTHDVRNLIGRGTEVIDAAGQTVTPGFIDAHAHVSGVAELVNVDVNLPSIADIQRAMAARAAETPPEFWVIGSMYDDTKLAEGRPVTRRDLDAAVPDHPAVLHHRGGHTGVYNSKAFAMAGITAQTPSPEGGRFYVENGELTGLVASRARAIFNTVGRTTEITREIRQAGVKLISERMAATGITSVHQTGTSSVSMVALQDAYRADEMRFRMYAFPAGGSDLYTSLRSAGIRTGFGDEWLRIGGVKYSADGSASERTMRMSEPYVGRPNDYGILTMTQEEIHEVVEDAHRAGWQVGIHANGDVTIEMVLNAYERMAAQHPRADPRHRIEHCSLVNPQLLRRIAAGGVIPTPFWTYAHFHGEKWVEYGPERMQWMFAHRSFLDHGIRVAGASDYPPGAFEPLMAIQSMVTRKDLAGRVWGPNQRITVEEALRIGTINGAYASFEEQIKGSISAGKLADFVMLAEDPHTADPDRIKEIQVVRTVVGGRTMHPGESA
ncbi:MAG TPA: amidohydrolase [Longimicrobiaceae bacterium]|nr:amidohydrolase [Longimicrobiaceae bacterium]